MFLQLSHIPYYRFSGRFSLTILNFHSCFFFRDYWRIYLFRDYWRISFPWLLANIFSVITGEYLFRDYMANIFSVITGEYLFRNYWRIYLFRDYWRIYLFRDYWRISFSSLTVHASSHFGLIGSAALTFIRYWQTDRQKQTDKQRI